MGGRSYGSQSKVYVEPELSHGAVFYAVKFYRSERTLRIFASQDEAYAFADDFNKRQQNKA